VVAGFELGDADEFSHGTGLCKRHRWSPLRCSLTCRQSSRSKLSDIYPVCTRRSPLIPPSPYGEKE
jgi:hypothetical protein